jgi:hypothetical protein
MIDVKMVMQALGELDEDRVIAALTEFVASGPTEAEALNVVNACQQGMAIIGELFEKGEYFVGDLIYAGDLMTRAIDIIKPVLQDTSSSKIGKIVLGTVKGDIHDIGKNIFKSLAEAAGFEIYDLGTDTPPESRSEEHTSELQSRQYCGKGQRGTGRCSGDERSFEPGHRGDERDSRPADQSRFEGKYKSNHRRESGQQRGL